MLCLPISFESCMANPTPDSMHMIKTHLRNGAIDGHHGAPALVMFFSSAICRLRISISAIEAASAVFDAASSVLDSLSAVSDAASLAARASNSVLKAVSAASAFIARRLAKTDERRAASSDPVKHHFKMQISKCSNPPHPQLRQKNQRERDYNISHTRPFGALWVASSSSNAVRNWLYLQCACGAEND